MSAFDKLPSGVQFAVGARVARRRFKFEIYNRLMENDVPQLTELIARRHPILLIGDRPAPDAPDDPKFHFTPFGAMRHSSLWLNLQLESADVKEDSLLWINAFDYKGNPNSTSWLKMPFRRIIALGGNAEKWIKKSGLDVKYEKVHHPQAWKRFHGSEPYPLLELLK